MNNNKMSTPTSLFKKSTHINRIVNILDLIILSAACAIVSIITIISIFTTGTFREVEERTNLLTTTEYMILSVGLPSAVFIFAACSLSFILYCVSYLWATYINTKSLGTCTAIYTLITSLLWIISLNATGNQYIYADSTSLIKAANEIITHQYESFLPDITGSPSSYHYFSWYPFQTGALLWFVIIFKLFGTGNIIAVQIINCLLLACTAWILQSIGTEIGLNEHGQRIEALIIMISSPIIMSAAFVYTNTAGLFFILLAMLTTIKACRQHNYRGIILWTVITFFISGFAAMIKGTVILFIIAFAIVLIISELERKLYWGIPVTLVAFCIAKWISGLSLPIVEHIVGQDFGNGLPQLSWIAIGLTQASAETPMPGWWNVNPIHIYDATKGDPYLQSQWAQTVILSSLSSFLHNPVHALQFFGAKLASEWSEPTYGTLYYSALMERRSNGTIASHAFYGSTNALLISFNNVLQTIIYVFSAFGFAHQCRCYRLKKFNPDTNIVFTCLSLVFIGGFCCFLLWEAKSIYIFPFYIMLIPISASGIKQIGDFLSKKKLLSLIYSNLHHKITRQ